MLIASSNHWHGNNLIARRWHARRRARGGAINARNIDAVSIRHLMRSGKQQMWHQSA